MLRNVLRLYISSRIPTYATLLISVISPADTARTVGHQLRLVATESSEWELPGIVSGIVECLFVDEIGFVADNSRIIGLLETSLLQCRLHENARTAAAAAADSLADDALLRHGKIEKTTGSRREKELATLPGVGHFGVVLQEFAGRQDLRLRGHLEHDGPFESLDLVAEREAAVKSSGTPQEVRQTDILDDVGDDDESARQ